MKKYFIKDVSKELFVEAENKERAIIECICEKVDLEKQDISSISELKEELIKLNIKEGSRLEFYEDLLVICKESNVSKFSLTDFAHEVNREKDKRVESTKKSYEYNQYLTLKEKYENIEQN